MLSLGLFALKELGLNVEVYVASEIDENATMVQHEYFIYFDVFHYKTSESPVTIDHVLIYEERLA